MAGYNHISEEECINDLRKMYDGYHFAADNDGYHRYTDNAQVYEYSGLIWTEKNHYISENAGSKPSVNHFSITFSVSSLSGKTVSPLPHSKAKAVSAAIRST